jgi:leader peptidase (prepilin peptidase)/N-methyltransferase
VFGVVIGSFLTVVVDRVPRGASIVTPRSACGGCGATLTAADLVPVFSWLVLRGRCRRCRARIGIEALVVELACAALFAAFAVRFGGSWELIAFCVLSAGLLALSVIDLHTMRLPRMIIYVTATLGAPLLVIAALVRNEPERITTMLIGAAIAGAFMGLVFVASRGGLGDGDVRLAPLLGGYLGWLGLGYVPVGLFLGFLFGAVVGVAAMIIGRAGRRTALPFGPFLAAGTVVAVFVGRSIIDALWVA